MNRAGTASLLTRCFDAFNAGDHAALLDRVSDDVAHDLNLGAREFGKEKLRWHLALNARHFESRISDVVIMVDEGGGRAAAEFTVRGRYLATLQGLPPAADQSFSLPAGVFLDIDDGLITRITAHVNRHELAARLSRG